MKTLIVVAHGSRRSASNEEILRLKQTLLETGGKSIDCVEIAFLEFVGPGPETVIETCIRENAGPIWVLPYFLAAGSHAAKDIPMVLENIRNRYPDAEITLLPHIGAAPGMAGLMLSLLP